MNSNNLKAFEAETDKTFGIVAQYSIGQNVPFTIEPFDAWSEWEKCFAWLPVKTTHGKTVWLNNVMRREDCFYCLFYYLLEPKVEYVTMDEYKLMGLNR